MKIFGKHIFRSIKSRPLQPIMIIIVIMLSVAVIIASVALPIGIYRNERAIYETDEWTPDLTITLKATSSRRLLSLEEAVEAIGDRGRVIGDFELGGFLDTLDEDGERVSLSISALSLVEADSFYELRYLDYGKITDKSLKTSAIISRPFAEDNNLDVGDNFTINILGNRFTFTVQAIALPTGIFRDKACLIDISSVRSALAERSPLIASLADDFEPYTRISVRLNDAELMDNIKSELESLDNFKDKQISLKGSASQGDFLATVLTLTIVIPAILLVIVSAALMISSLELLQKKRSSDIALFKIVGADEGHINSMLYMESVFYGALGGVLGCLISIPVISWLNSIYSFKYVSLSLGAFEIMIGLGASIAFVLISTALHIRKQKQKTLQNELSSGNFDTEKKLTVKKLFTGIPVVILAAIIFALPPRYRYIPATAFIIAFVIFLYVMIPYAISAMALLISKLLSKSKRGMGDLILASKACENSYPLKHAGRMITTLISIGVSLTLVLFAAQSQLDSYVKFAQFDQVAMACDEETQRMISELEGVKTTAESTIYRNVVFEGFTTTIGVGIVGEAEGCFDKAMLPKNLPKGNNIALSTGVAEMLGLKVGDEVTCAISGDEFTFILSEIVEIYGDFAYYDLEHVGIQRDMLCIVTDGTEQTREALTALLDERGVLHMKTEEYLLPIHQKLNPQFKVFGVMMCIIVLMTVLGVSNILSEQRIARMPEFDILKQNGKTKSGLIALQIVEVVYLLICALTVSLLASSVLCFALNKIAVSFGMTIFI